MDSISSHLPTDDTAIRLLTNMATASIQGDNEALLQALQDWGTLSPTKRAEFEQLVSLVIPPWILPMQLFTIFSNPDEYMGVTRLSNEKQQDFAKMLADATTSSIVLSALVNWAQNEQNIAKNAQTDAAKGSSGSEAVKTDQTGKADQASLANQSSISNAMLKDATTSDNPIDRLLGTFISSGGGNASTDSVATMQFLRSNPILLAGLQTADPVLAEQAYNIAISQIVISCLDRFIETQAILHQQQIDANRRRESQGLTPREQLRNDLYNDIKTGSTPLTQLSLLAMQMLTINAGVFQIGAMAPAGATAAAAPITGLEAAANIATITSAELGLTVAQKTFPNDFIATGVMVSLPALFEGKENQLTSTQQLQELAQLSSTIVQMVPYWITPAAISFQQASDANAANTAKTIPESAVRAFVAGVVAMMNDPSFTLLVQNSILRNAIDPSRISPEQLKAYVAAIKITLLANATLALYKIYLNKTPDELARLFGIPENEAEQLLYNPRIIADAVLGKSIAGTDLLKELIKLMRETLKDIPEENREKFINGLFGSYSPNTPVEDLIDAPKQFLGLCEYISSTEERG